MLKYLSFLLLFSIAFANINANQIDIGIYNSQTTPDKIELYLRPDFDISDIETVTAILYTVRWENPSVSISSQYIFPFFVSPQGNPEEYNGYYYQIFAAIPMNAIPMNANEEYLVSTFTYTDGECANFEIIEDEWTQSHNGNVYFEFIGVEVTGIIYEQFAYNGSAGGFIAGNDSISSGSSTGLMTLYSYNGSVLTWQRKMNNGSWSDIAGTSGLVLFEETPTGIGLWKYRVKVKYGSCPVVFSDSLELTIVITIELNLKIYLEGSYENQQMSTTLNVSGLLPLAHPYNVTPWNYNGEENVSGIPNADVVDWILIEIRETEGDASSATNEKAVYVKAGFLLDDGQITDITGSSKLTFTSAFIDNHFVLIWHRNHLGVIASQPMAFFGNTYVYDFSYSAARVLGGTAGYVEFENGFWGMAAGDINADKVINYNDKAFGWEADAALHGYLAADANLDIQVNNPDKNDFILQNLGKVSGIQD